MEIISIEDIQKMGGFLLPDDRLKLQNNLFVKGSTFPAGSKNFVFSIVEKYRACGIECILVG
jgi:hypothetical protein